MTASVSAPAPPPAPPALHTPTPVPPPTAWGNSVLAPVAAGIATLCSATSLTGVVTGAAWLGYIFVAVVLVACTGLALRSLRTPTIVVGLSQLLVLLFLVVGSFTTTGIVKIIPGPAAFAELGDVMIYLTRLADVLGVDLVQAALDKLDHSAHRYPVEQSRGSAAKAPHDQPSAP